jgi:hypothetical protein
MDMKTFLTTKVQPKIEEILEQSVELEFGEEFEATGGVKKKSDPEHQLYDYPDDPHYLTISQSLIIGLTQMSAGMPVTPRPKRLMVSALSRDIAGAVIRAIRELLTDVDFAPITDKPLCFGIKGMTGVIRSVDISNNLELKNMRHKVALERLKEAVKEVEDDGTDQLKYLTYRTSKMKRDELKERIVNNLDLLLMSGIYHLMIREEPEISVLILKFLPEYLVDPLTKRMPEAYRADMTEITKASEEFKITCQCLRSLVIFTDKLVAFGENGPPTDIPLFVEWE